MPRQVEVLELGHAGRVRLENAQPRVPDRVVSQSEANEATQQGPKKRKRNEDCLPSRGLFAIDALKHFSRLAEAEVIGADPGKSELLVCANVSANNPLQRRDHPSARLTNAQRRHETKVPLHIKKREEGVAVLA